MKEKYTDDIKKLMISVRDNPVTIAISCNAPGKTHGAARIAAWFYKAFPNSQVYTAAAPPESNLKKLLWGEIGEIIEKHPNLFKKDTYTYLNIGRSSKSFLTGVIIPSTGTEQQREAKFSGKHAPYILFIVDEGDAVPDEVFRGIDSCMSGGYARLLIMFNPREETGAVYRMIRDKQANVVHLSVFNHPNVKTGEDIFPGAVTRETTVRRVNEWCRPLHKNDKPTSGCFELPSFLAGEVARSKAGVDYPPLKPGWYRVVEPAFSYMVLGEYPAMGSNQLISKEWTARARSRYDIYVAEFGDRPPVGASGIQGQDVADSGDDDNASCFRYGGFVEPLITWRGVDTIVTGERAAAEHDSRGIDRVYVDGTGVGAGVAPAMTRLGCHAVKVMVASKPTEKTEIGEFKILRDQLWWKIREWLRTDPGAMLPPDELLLEELHTPTYTVQNGKVQVMKKDDIKDKIRRSPNRADALKLTFATPDLVFPNL